MKRAVFTVLAPPVVAARYGCARFCAAPIAVFWVTGIIAIGYGAIGGPTHLLGPSWNTVLLGFTLWGIAVVWTTVTYLSANVDKPGPRATVRDNEPDPLDEVRKAHQA